MTRSPSPGDEMDAAIRAQVARQRLARTDTDVGVTQHLARIGVLGWTIVSPPLAGLITGRWLDHRAGSGVTFSAALLLAGFVAGGLSAWKWMNHPHA